MPLREAARARRGGLINEVPATCDHATAGNAVALVHLLQDFELEPSIADGMCEWNPDHPDMRPLWRAWRKINKETV